MANTRAVFRWLAAVSARHARRGALRRRRALLFRGLVPADVGSVADFLDARGDGITQRSIRAFRQRLPRALELHDRFNRFALIAHSSTLLSASIQVSRSARAARTQP